MTTGVEQALQRQWEVPGGRRRTAAAQPVHRALGQSWTCEVGVGVGGPDPDLLHHGGRQGHRERGDRRVRVSGGETDLAAARECEQGVQIRGTAGARRRALLHGEPVRQRPRPVRRHQGESQELGQRAGRIQLVGRDGPQQPRPEPRHGGGRHPPGECGAVQQDGDQLLPRRGGQLRVRIGEHLLQPGTAGLQSLGRLLVEPVPTGPDAQGERPVAGGGRVGVGLPDRVADLGGRGDDGPHREGGDGPGPGARPVEEGKGLGDVPGGDRRGVPGLGSGQVGQDRSPLGGGQVPVEQYPPQVVGGAPAPADRVLGEAQ